MTFKFNPFTGTFDIVEPLSDTAPANVTKDTAASGTSTETSRADHKHDISTAAPSSIGTTNTEGTSTSLARADHVHNHGAQTDGTLHAVATGSVAGFMSAADKTALDWNFGIQQRIIVAKNATVITGKSYTSIKDACDYADTVASSSNKILVDVFPGEYTESPFTIPAYVLVTGQDKWSGTHIITNNNSISFITVEANSALANVGVTGPTGTGFAAIDQTQSGTSKLYWINIKVGDYGVWLHATSGTARSMIVGVVSESGTGSVKTLFRATNNAGMVLMQSGPMTGSGWLYGVYADGSGARVTLDLCFFKNTGGVSIFADNLATIRGIACSFVSGTTAIEAGAAGALIDMNGSFISTSHTTDIKINSNSLGSCTYSGVASISKLTVATGASFTANIFDDGAAEGPGNFIFGELYVGATPSQTTPLTSYTEAQRNTGLASGGAVTRGTGLDVDVAAGVGYMETANGIKEIVWASDTITLAASEPFIAIYIDSDGVVQQSTSDTGYVSRVILAEAITDADEVLYLSTHGVVLPQFRPTLHEYLEHVVGPINVSGGIVTENGTTALNLDVTDSTYYVYEQERESVGATPVTFTYWYKDGSGGWIGTPGQTAIDDENYDDGTGTLAAIPATEYKRDLVFVNTNDGGTEYHVIYGQDTWATSNEAVTNPSAPPSMLSTGCRLAALIVLKSAGSIETIIDQRPRLGQLAAATTGASVHNDLTGRDSATAHTQYQLGSEKGAANGYAPLDGSSDVPIANLPVDSTLPSNVTKATATAGTANTLARVDHKHDISTAAPPATSLGGTSVEGVATSVARSDHVHQSNTAPANVTKAAAVIGTSGEPARADHKHDITTASASTIGTANSEGSATSLARSDHGHDHGSQTTGTHHAVATTSVNGFMSAADKTKLDGFSIAFKQEIVTKQTVDASTTSSTYTTLMSQAITTTSGTTLRISFTGALSVSNTSQASLRIRVDDTNYNAVGVKSASAGAPFAFVLRDVVTGLSAGSHTVSIVWLTSGGTLRIRPVAAPNDESAILTLEEYI